jgi:cell division protein FtsB
VALERAKTNFFRVVLLGMFFIILVVSWLAFGDRGFKWVYTMEKERQEYLERIKKLELANQDLRKEIDRLKYDRDYIETQARRELGLLKENEVIYKFNEEEK